MSLTTRMNEYAAQNVIDGDSIQILNKEIKDQLRTMIPEAVFHEYPTKTCRKSIIFRLETSGRCSKSDRKILWPYPTSIYGRFQVKLGKFSHRIRSQEYSGSGRILRSGGKSLISRLQKENSDLRNEVLNLSTKVNEVMKLAHK